MHTLSNLRIGQRLALGSAVILPLSIVSTSFALLNSRSSAAATKLMMGQPLARERLVSDCWPRSARPTTAGDTDWEEF